MEIQKTICAGTIEPLINGAGNRYATNIMGGRKVGVIDFAGMIYDEMESLKAGNVIEIILKIKTKE